MQSYLSHTILHRVKSGFVFYSNKVDFKTNPFCLTFQAGKIIFFFTKIQKKIYLKTMFTVFSRPISVGKIDNLETEIRYKKEKVKYQN